MRPPCYGRTDEMFPRADELYRHWKERSSVLIATLCNVCPTRKSCYESGKDERHGIWGGTTEHDRGYTLSGVRLRKSRAK